MKSTKVAVKAIRAARKAVEFYIEWNESGDGGPIAEAARGELVRVKAEVQVLMVLLEEALSRKQEEQA